eukprot:4964852-Pyramimonas_sp.AAC.1
MRSLTACCIIADDPTWRAACAPVLRRGKEAWLAQTRTSEHSLSRTELRDSWAAVWGQDNLTWGLVGGPISALRLCL